MHTVTFKITFWDWVEGLKIGLTHMTLLYRAIWLGICLLLTIGFMITLWYAGYPNTWPPTALPSLRLLFKVSAPLGVSIAVYLLLSLIGWLLTRRRIVTLQDDQLVIKSGFRRHHILWHDITDLLDTGRHLCFCENVPTAVVIPKSAFSSQKETSAFLEDAKHYWREANGIPPPPVPDAFGVWPPAPHTVPPSETPL